MSPGIVAVLTALLIGVVAMLPLTVGHLLGELALGGGTEDCAVLVDIGSLQVVAGRA